MNVFTVSYPKTPGNPFYYQLQIFADINTGEVCHINLTGIAWTEIKEIKNENYIDEIAISTDIRKHTNIKPNKKPVLTTGNFNCKLIYRNGSIINLELKDEVIKAQ